MKKEAIQALLDPRRVAAIDKRAEAQGLGDVWATAAARAQAEVPGKNPHAELALAAIRIQQLVGLIPARADQENFEKGLQGKAPKPFKVEEPTQPLPVATEEIPVSAEAAPAASTAKKTQPAAK